MADLNTYLHTIEELVNGATKGLFAKLDHMTFKMTINGLKGTDYEAVSILIDQLVKEKRAVSIPPLYVVAKAHPVMPLRSKAQSALKAMDPDNEIDRLTAGKDMKDAVKALVEHYGNYKQG